MTPHAEDAKAPSEEQIRLVMAWVGRHTSDRKKKTSAENGRKGGRPRKDEGDAEKNQRN